VTRCHDLDEPGPLASALLPRVAQLAMAGGNDAEQGSGGKLNLRAVIGLTEAARQPALVAHLAEVARLKERVADAIRAEIAGALPVSDLDALASGLAAEGPAVEVGALLSHLGTPRAGATPGSGPASGAAPMEAAASARLRRLVLLARGLGELHERAAGERTGLPRARVGVVLDPALAAQWGVRFPHNPFQAPVVVAGAGALVPMAHGLLRGQIHETADGLALVHRAQLELDKPADAAKAGPPRARPWAELSAADRALCAPVLVVGTDALLDEPGLAELLDAGLPVKLLVLSELDLRVKGRELDLLARARRGAWAAQTSLGAPAHFARSVMIALAHDGPAILRAHAPSPTHHGFPTRDALARARGAVASRAWPLLRYDPAADGVFGTRVDLSGNPAKAVEAPSAWAAGEGRFSGADLAAADVERAATWALLQELSGALTPFTERVRAEVVAELGATHQAELARVRAEAEARVAAIEAETLARAARLVEDRLMRLAGYEAEEPA
jgi:pyruvate-ferredoxin/flavodoxin oxidoreductase